MHKILLLTLLLGFLGLQSCSECYDQTVPYEEFDFAIVNELRENLVGPNARYDIEDIRFEVEGSDIIIGNYIKDDIQFFIVDYSQLSESDLEARLFISDESFLATSLRVKSIRNSCFPHNTVEDLVVDGQELEVKEQILIFK